MTGSDQHNASSGRAGRGFVIFAALIIIAAGLKAAQAIVVPMLLAAFIATIAASPMFWFKAKGMSNGLALGSVVLGIFLTLGLIAALLTQSTSAFSAKLPFYQERLAVLQSDVIVLLQGLDHSSLHASIETNVEIQMIREKYKQMSLETLHFKVNFSST